MNSICYAGTVAGWRDYGRKALLTAAFSGMMVAKDAARVQRRLDGAARQDRVRSIITSFGADRGGASA